MTTSNSPTRGRRRLATTLILAGIAASLVLTAPGVALARRPSAPTTSATVTAAPNPVGVYQTLTISGTGYKASTQLQVQISTSSSVGYIYAASDSTGSFSFMTSIATVGTAKISVYQSARKGFTLQASTSVLVQ